jgi:WD40 repeat protein
MVAVISLALAAVAMLAPWARRTPERGVARFTVTAPPGYAVFEDAMVSVISPDGRTLAFAVVDSAGISHLCLRSLDTLEPHLIPGSDNMEVPFWSADSRFVGFFSDGKLRKVPAAGGDVEVVCDAKNGRGGTWNKDDVIVFARAAPDRCSRSRPRVARRHPSPRSTPPVTRAPHRFPLFLRDGKHFIFTSLPSHNGKFDVWLGALDSPQRQLVMSTFVSPVVVPTGHVVFQKGRSLVAQRFDASAGRVTGQTIALPDFPATSQYTGYRIASASDAGDLAYVNGREHNTQLVWLDRSGRKLGVLKTPPGRYTQASLSPDGGTVAVLREDTPSSSDLWLVDVAREVTTRFTFESSGLSGIAWSPDGKRIAFGSERNGLPSLVVKSVDGASPETTLVATGNLKNFGGWSADGKYIHLRAARRAHRLGRVPRARRWERTGEALLERPVQRTLGLDLARRALDAVRVGRVGSARALRSELSEFGEQVPDHHRRRWHLRVAQRRSRDHVRVLRLQVPVRL